MLAGGCAWRYLFGVAAICLAGCSATKNVGGSLKAAAPTAQEIEQRGVIGALGIPVGKIAEMSGRMVVTPQFWSAKNDEVFLSVDMVSGRVLAAPVIMRLVVPEDLLKPVALPKPGDDVSVTGFERCYYDGLSSDVAPLIQTGAFRFTTDLVVLDLQDPYIPATQPATRPDPVSINEIVQRGVIGSLGKPLGDGMTVSGTVVDQPRVDEMGGDWRGTVSVDRVDGVVLPHPVSIKVGVRVADVSVAPATVGKLVTLFGYETGGYEGYPEAAFSYLEPNAQEEMHFTTFFAAWPDSWRVRSK
jgi:hypothetical protein